MDGICNTGGIAIAWISLPPYAAYCLAELVHRYPGKVTILGTRTNIRRHEAHLPHKGVEEMVGEKVIWLERDETYRWKDLGLEVPDYYIHTGWAYPAFNSLGSEVNRSGGMRCSMIDSIWRRRWKQYLGLLYFRLVYRNRFDKVMVPGRASRRFCRLMGMPDHRIFEGLYGANPGIFFPGPPLAERPKRILFVGQLIKRKGVLQLLEAARRSQARGDGWEFVLVGSGPFEAMAQAEPAVRVEPFGDPGEIADWMRSSRFLVLPSLREMWGVVVHEAALCGCGLILAEDVGAGEELLSARNGVVVRKGSAQSLSEAYSRVSEWSEEDYVACEAESLKLASRWGPERFADSVSSMLFGE